MAFETTQAHEDIFNAVKAKDGHIQIEAVAGSGKTTTIIRALDHVSPYEKVVFLAFNKSIATELSHRLPKCAEARTLNSLGHRLWMSHLRKNGGGRVQLDTNKNKKLLDKCGLEDRVKFTIMASVLKLVGLAKSHGIIPGSPDGILPDEEKTWWYLVDHYDVDLPEMDGDAFGLVRQTATRILKASIRWEDVIDFDDQLYLPFVKGAEGTRYDRVIVDEAQDLSPLQHWLVGRSLKRNGQLIAVGDPQQAIYGFRGADSSSMQTMHETFNTKRLPLHVSYRCPKNVIAEAQKEVPHIKAHDSAPEGLVDHKVYSMYDHHYGAGDLVVSRTTAPAVKLAYQLIREKIPCCVLGRDIGKGLIGVLKKLKTENVDQMLIKLDDWEANEVRKAMKRDATGAAQRAQDKAETIRILAEDQTSVSEMMDLIENMFSAHPSERQVTICTVHKAKGLEADRVTILNPHLMPHPMAKKAWAREQEKNIKYVAVTRAKKSLGFVTSEH